MWTLPQPSVEEADSQLRSALTYANGSPVYELTASERAAIKAVYNLYDSIHGQPHRDLMPGALDACRDAIRDSYDQVQIGGRLADLRASLLSSTDACPYCGFGEPTQLDHFLPKDKYGELAIYPRNLVPSCGPCNNSKRSVEPGVAGNPGLIHAYFQQLPDITFMRADVDFVSGALEVSYKIETGILEAQLEQMLQFQLDRLKLNERYPRQINKFLSEQRFHILLLKEAGQPSDGLSVYLARSASALARIFGLNDWRSALLKALSANSEFCEAPERYLGMRATEATEDATIAA